MVLDMLDTDSTRPTGHAPVEWWRRAFEALSLDEFIFEHAGVVSRTLWQEAAGDITTIRRRLRRRDWTRIFPGVYFTERGQPPRLSREIAALLYAGSGAMWSHHTAATQQGLCRGGDAAWVDVTVPAARRVASQPGIRVYRARDAASRLLNGIVPPRVTPAHAVVDMLGMARGPDEALALVADCCQSGRVQLADVVEVLVLRPTRWGRLVRDAATSTLPGSDSLLEVKYARDVEGRHHLPSSRRQLRVECDVSDCMYDDFDVTIELDGRLHLGADRRWRDMRKDNRSALRGELTLRYGWYDVDSRPCIVAAQVVAVLRRQGFTGVVRRCKPGCLVA